MLRSTLPPRRYGTTDYPNIDPDAIGRPIPIGYGTLTGLIPVQIDTTDYTFKALDQDIQELTAVRSAENGTLDYGIEYTRDLTKAEFTLLMNENLTPGSSHTYYFAVECDHAISAINYLSLARNTGTYDDGMSYAIANTGVWTGETEDLLFVVYGKASVSEAEQVLATNTGEDSSADLALRDANARSKVGQSFKVSVSAFVTRIEIFINHHGDIGSSNNIRLMLYSDTGSTQIGPDGTWLPIPDPDDWVTDLGFPERNEDLEVECDVKAPGTEMKKVSSIIEDVLTNVLDKSSGLLDATELANLATDRTQDLSVYIGDEIEFGEFLAKLEAGQLWKLVPIPGDSQTYGTVVAETGEPANLLTLRDHDLLSFKMEYDVGDLKQKATVFYAQDPVVLDYPAVQSSSDIAKFFYINNESQSIETYLEDKADAETLADAYRDRYEVPVIKAIFEIHAKGIELLPWRDKVKIYRTRAGYAGGTLNGVLFRIVKLVKKPSINVVEITAAIWANSAT